VTTAEALEFVRMHGVVLESGNGPVPSLASAVAGESIRGSWWAHSRGREIFAATRAVRECPDVLVCRLIDNKITYVHCRLWPALVRISRRFSAAQLRQVSEVHTASGAHRVQEIPFPDWVPADDVAQASSLSEEDAFGLLGNWSRKGYRPRLTR